MGQIDTSGHVPHIFQILDVALERRGEQWSVRHVLVDHLIILRKSNSTSCHFPLSCSIRRIDSNSLIKPILKSWVSPFATLIEHVCACGVRVLSQEYFSRVLMPNCCINEFFKLCTDGVGARLTLMYGQCLSIKKDGEVGLSSDAHRTAAWLIYRANIEPIRSVYSQAN